MKPKHLEARLQQLDTFEAPKLELEQYATPPELAVAIIDQIQRDENAQLDQSLVVDLGCGCGMLSMAALFSGAPFCLGIDIDPGALEICRQNADELLPDSASGCLDLILADLNLPLPLRENCFDLALSNPPFGTKNNSSADWKFVKAGLELLSSGSALYSLHKTASRRVLEKKAGDSRGLVAAAKCVAELRWPLAKTYRHHRETSKDIAVDLFRIVKI